MEIINVAVEKVTPYANNPRLNDQAVAKVAASIKEFGWRQPIVVDEDFVIIVGHTRLKAAQNLGLKEVPVNVARELSAEQVKAYRIADNRVAQEAEWDSGKLKIELESFENDFPELDLSILGFNEDELENLKVDLNELDKEPDEAAEKIPEEVETRCSLGDLWQLGDHFLLCGDSTLLKNYKVLLEDDLIDLVITDPPYNVDYGAKCGSLTKEKKAVERVDSDIQNDKMGRKDFQEFLYGAFINMFTFMREGSAIYVFHSDSESVNFRQAYEQSGFKLSETLLWVKHCFSLGRKDYHYRHEPILYGWKEGEAHKWYSDRKQTTVLEFDKPMKSKEHPTMKPIEILQYLISNSSKQGDIVWDSFLGSGSTLIACEKLKRKCYGLELEPKYCDVILTRWEEYTGKEAIKIRGANGAGDEPNADGATT